MHRSFVIMMAFALLLASSLPLAQATEPPTRIIAVQYPATVQTGALFIVNVQVEYSARFGMMDVGIWDLGTGSVVQSLVTNATLSGPGYGGYRFLLKAPGSTGLWRLAAITRAWVLDAWFNDEAGEFDFSVQIAENGLLVLSEIQPNLTISLDGRPIVANSSSVVLSLKLGSVYSLGVPPQLQVSLGRRLIFTSWSDGQSSNPRIIMFTGNMSIAPIYVTQYLLTVNSDLGVAGGGGWYREGEVAQFGIPSMVQNSPTFLGLMTDSSRFTNWTGDSASTEPISTVLMDGPKTIDAQWKHSIFPNINALSGVLVLGALMLGINALIRNPNLGRRRRSTIFRFLIILMIATPAVISPILPVSGQLPAPANAVVVQIGDAYWYYWKQPASDTCILWLGGGVERSQGGYLLNPLEYESFGTIRFLQDLTKYYCLVALERGSTPSPREMNRTIYQELFQGQFSIGRQIHQWISAQGYKHIFLIGYSVGTEAAASIATSDPQTWTSTDGLILITAWLPPYVVNGASSLNSNLMMLYGHAPTFEPTGLRFYQNAPTEGWHQSGYLHKEFHVLDQMGHEVWSPLKDNSYSTMATGITVNFIETSKALQLDRVRFKSNVTMQNVEYSISQPEAPRSVLCGEPFFVSAYVTPSYRSSMEVALAAYDFSTNQLLSIHQFNSTVLPASIRLNIPSIANASQQSFSLIVLERDSEGWKIASNPYPMVVSASDQIVLQVNGLVPNSDFIVDSKDYPVHSTGQLQVEMSPGFHSYGVPETVYQNNTRFLFVQWDDSNISTVRSITITENTTLSALYRVQYFVNVTSPTSTTAGSGWYDANSISQPSLNSIVIGPASAFAYWTDGKQSFQLGDPIQIRFPTLIQAVWVHEEPSTQVDGSFTWLLASGTLFALMLILNVNLSRNRRVKEGHV